MRFEIGPNVPQDASEHGRCEASGEGVLLARMIRGEDARKASGKLVHGAVGEWVGRMSGNQTPPFEDLEISLESDPA